MARALLALTFALALLAGCGGGDDDNGGSGGSSGGGGGGEAMSKDEFVSEANKICREGEAKLTEVTRDSASKIQEADSAEEQQKVVADVLENSAKEYDPYMARLRDLNPPEELSADWDKFLDGVEHAFDLIPDLADATREGDREKLQGLTDDFTKIAGETRPFAQKNGLDDCLPDNSGATS
jgi:hypothetical protein